MKKSLLILALVFSFVGVIQAQEKDPLDITKELDKIEEYGVPTVNGVEKQGLYADSLYVSKDWNNAISALLDYAKSANWLANLLSQCGEPYYSASYDDKKSASYSSLKPIVPFENKSNDLKRERNIAYVKIGICYKELGETKKAVVYLYKGLDLLSMDERYYWDIARDAIAEIVGFHP